MLWRRRRSEDRCSGRGAENKLYIIIQTRRTHLEYCPIFVFIEEVIESNSFRKDKWRASHLRTFKYKLWKNLDKNDLKDGEKYYEMTYDQAIMLPLLEMASERSKYIPQILYVYNKDNPLNVDKIKADNKLNSNSIKVGQILKMK